MGIQIIQSDCRDALAGMPDESVHCVVTSSPYWGLRDYGIEPQVWGGDVGCAHEWGDMLPPKPGRGNKPGDLSTSSLTNPERQDTVPRAADAGTFCHHCNAWRGSLGLEPTIELYVEHITDVFREVRRVLRKDGTCWLNLGDGYSHGGNGSRDPVKWSKQSRNDHRVEHAKTGGQSKPKDLLMMPSRVALALQDDGWWVRSEIIWHKPNPMPESVTDRPTSAHEKIFLLTKSARYFYDAEAVREVAKYGYLPGVDFAKSRGGTTKDPETAQQVCWRPEDGADPSAGRNLRNVWTVATAPYPDAHFATFPPALIEPCIKAGCPEGGTVLDPFAGAGTTGLVADRLGRNAILIELNSEYAAMARRRIEGDCPMFTEVST